MIRTTTPPAEPPPARAWVWEATYPGTASQARHVRVALRSLLGGCPAADDVLLVVSELAANAIAHSDSGRPGGTFTVRLDHACGDRAYAEVEDQGSSWDGDLATCTRRPHGLYLVRALSAACGTGRGPGLSRRVWAHVDDAAGTGPASAAPGGQSARAWPDQSPSTGCDRTTSLPPPPAAAARLARVLAEHPCWSVFWDRRHGLWRAAEDDLDSLLYAESRDLDMVIGYITGHP